MTTVTDFARTLMRIRTDRARKDPGPAPRLHGYIHYEKFRMKVTVNPSSEYWSWLTLAGWRECNYPRDRREYIDLPAESFKKLASRTSASREDMYLRLMERYGA